MDLRLEVLPPLIPLLTITLLGLSTESELKRCDCEPCSTATSCDEIATFAVDFFLPRNKNLRAMAALVSFEVGQLLLLPLLLPKALLTVNGLLKVIGTLRMCCCCRRKVVAVASVR